MGVDAALFNVRRSGVSGAPILMDRSVDLSDDGNAIGLQLRGLLQLSIHF